MTAAVTGMPPVVAAPRGPGLPAGTGLVLDSATAVREDGGLLLGGSPWRVARLHGPARALVARLRTARAAATPVVARGDAEETAADALVERGMVHPVVRARPATDVTVVVPAYGRPDLLARCLAGLRESEDGGGVAVVVVDDASPDPAAVARVAAAHGARLVRHDVNRGPGAARNTGLAHVRTGLVAFLDSDCETPRGWLDHLVPLFDDPRVGAVAPRVVPQGADATLLGRFEAGRSALDMGPHRRLVRPGARLGFLPSAALVVRRSAVGGQAFDPELRVGEDVDLVWRLAGAGWHVRYEPSVTVGHEPRPTAAGWVLRRYQYGTSAAGLDRRHPGRLAPARASAWTLAVLGLLVARRPLTAGVVHAASTTMLARRLGPRLAVPVVAQGLVADTVAVGHALRREWWPLGWLALAAAVGVVGGGRGGSTARGTARRLAVAAAATVVAPLALEWWRTRPGMDPLRYAALRLAEDAAYGSGVLVSAVRAGRPRALLPVVRLPGTGQRRGRTSATRSS